MLGPIEGNVGMQLELTSGLLRQLRYAADEAAPEEACGLLFGTLPKITSLMPARNVSKYPRTRFEIDPQALVDAHRAARRNGPAVAGYYHSHPSGQALPSKTDRAMANGDGRAWAIVGKEQILFWRDMGDGFEALPYRVVDG